MFELVVKSHFCAAHQVVGHSGKCARMHGHNFNVEAYFTSPDVDAIGIAIDFADLKLAINEVIDSLDHISLNDLPEFTGSTKNNPTAENIARFLYKKLETSIKKYQGAKVTKVTIWETEKYAASYFELK